MIHTITIPLRLVSEANAREHWAQKAKRVKAQRAATRLALATSSACRVTKRLSIIPCNVTITRIAPRALDVGDNLEGSGKAVRDEIARYFGVDDGPRGPIVWHVAQRKGRPREYAVEIQLEWRV